MPPPEPVLICALSGRALAQAARAAGFAPIVLDAFGDLDTRAVAEAWHRVPVDRSWRWRKGALLAAARRLAPPPIPLVWGSGFERVPGLLAELCAGRELLGNAASVVRVVTDPLGFAASATLLEINYPEVRVIPPTQGLGWLCKRVGGAGGAHVRRAGPRVPTGRGWYWQRRARGEPISALVVGNGRDARLLAIGRQLVAPRPGRPFRFAGVLAPADISSAASRELERVAPCLAERYRLRGLASVDALVAGDDVTVLELNPRPGGSLDAHGAALGINLFALHVSASRGGPLAEPIAAARCAGSLIAFADRATFVPAGFPWPEWAADRSPQGSAISAGGPICTVLAQGAEAEPLLPLLRARAEQIRAALRVTSVPCGKLPLRYDGQATAFSRAAQ